MIPTVTPAGTKPVRPSLPAGMFYSDSGQVCLTDEYKGRLRRTNLGRLALFAAEQRLQPKQPQHREWKAWR